MKEATLIFFGSWKFAATFPVAIFGMKMSAVETILYINIGGILGVILFSKFWEAIIIVWKRLFPKKNNPHNHKNSKRVFSRRNRRIIKLKSRYGLAGIVILNPILLSIPVASFLVTKYYGNKIINLAWLIVGQVVWSFIYTVFYFNVYALI